MKSFRKNLEVTLMSFLTVAIYGYLKKLDIAVMVDLMTILLIFSVLNLIYEDVCRKGLFKDTRAKQTWQYYAGLAFIWVANLAFADAFVAISMRSMWIRLACSFLLLVLGAVWFGTAYPRSLRSDDERTELDIQRQRADMQRWWKGVARKIVKEKNPEEKKKRLDLNLRYRLSGDVLGGDLDFSRPLAVVGSEALTHEELQAVRPVTEGVIALRKSIPEYFQTLLAE